MKNAYYEELEACTVSQFMLIKYEETKFNKFWLFGAAEIEQCAFDLGGQCGVILWAYLNITT
jgi:hypothetical protein